MFSIGGFFEGYETCTITLDEEHLHFDVDKMAMGRREVAEVPSSDEEPESERCIMASDIVTILGNALAMAEGAF